MPYTEPPNLLMKALLFMRSAAKVARGGFKFADEKVVRRRVALCENCPNLTNRNQCLGCGCDMESKVHLADMKCPDGKW